MIAVQLRFIDFTLLRTGYFMKGINSIGRMEENLIYLNSFGVVKVIHKPFL